MRTSNPRSFLTTLFGLALLSAGCYSATPSREPKNNDASAGDGSADSGRSQDVGPRSDGSPATEPTILLDSSPRSPTDTSLTPDAPVRTPDGGTVEPDTAVANPDSPPDFHLAPADSRGDVLSNEDTRTDTTGTPPAADAADAALRDLPPDLSRDLPPDQPQTPPDTGPACGGGCCTHSDCPMCQSCSATHACVDVVNAEDPAGRCAGICDATSTCKSKKGQTCQKVAAGCASGTTCAPDGICCDQACNSSCMACDIAGFEGTCTPVASGNPHGNRASCGTDATCAGTCAGRSDGQCSFPSKPCGAAASCSGTDMAQPQSTCVSGVCQPSAAVPCLNGFSCAAGACNTTCTTSVDCQADYFCSGGTCHSDVVSVGTGSYHTCAGLKNGRVVCWGTGPHVIGDNTTHTDPVTQPIQVYGLADAKLVRAGQRHTCALRASGGVSCWGMGQYGQLGTGMPAGGLSSYFSDAPVSVVKSEGGQLTGATDLSAGQDAFCAVTSAGPYCWGANSGGQLGYDTSAYGENVVAATLLSSCTGDKLVVMGGLFLAGLGTAGNTGAIDLWGYNSGGIVKSPGDYLTYPSCQSQTVFLSTYVSNMAAGLSHICVLLNSGAVQCWGANDAGQLGNGATSSAPDVVPGHTIPSFTATRLTAGGTFTCALTSATGTVTCWGSNMAQVISADNSVTTYPNPTSMTLNLPAGLTVTEIASSPIASHMCAIISDGSLMCWGSNYYRQTGVDTTATFVRPAFVKVNW
jgi:alpha-tubulin suppressor-like RCC1 family protein